MTAWFVRPRILQAPEAVSSVRVQTELPGTPRLRGGQLSTLAPWQVEALTSPVTLRGIVSRWATIRSIARTVRRPPALLLNIVGSAPCLPLTASLIRLLAALRERVLILFVDGQVAGTVPIDRTELLLLAGPTTQGTYERLWDSQIPRDRPIRHRGGVRLREPPLNN